MLFTSRYEAWGMPVMEAMASGLAVVATHCLGVATFAVHGQNALLADSQVRDSRMVGCHCRPRVWIRRPCPRRHPLSDPFQHPRSRHDAQGEGNDLSFGLCNTGSTSAGVHQLWGSVEGMPQPNAGQDVSLQEFRRKR